MKYELIKPFQEKAFMALLSRVEKAKLNYSIDSQSLVIPFVAPTGAGKTVMAAALIEALYWGYGSIHEGNRNTTILWLSDSPNLNEQSMRSIETIANKLVIGQCVLLNDSFKAEQLEDGKIYFLNTQKLAKGKDLVTRKDQRSTIAWEFIQNTISEKGESFILIIDEAHRGMKNKKDQNEQMGIMQRFLRGYEYTDEQGVNVKMSSMPIIIGMSATIKRFNVLVDNCNNLMKLPAVEVTPKELRESGLIKQTIELHIPENPNFVEMSYLADAAKEWKRKCQHWEAYKEHEPDVDVKPILIVQVKNAKKHKISDTDLEECMKQIMQSTNMSFGDGEVVHAFDSDKTLELNGVTVQYKSPADIDADKRIKIVFFKDALNYGWDCPRAEAMMSFRVATDDTYIAQLLGRMVRTPLHKKIETDDTLNDVHLFLPNFNKENADAIVEKFKEDGGVASDVKVNSKETQELTAEGVLPCGIERAEILKAINDAHLLSYPIPKNGVSNYVTALFKLCFLLTRESIYDHAIKDVKAEVVERIIAYVKELKAIGKYNETINEIDNYVDNNKEAQYDVVLQGQTRTIKRVFYDLERWYDFADTLIGKCGVHNAYMLKMDEEYDDREIRCHVIAFTKDVHEMQQLGKYCESRFNGLVDDYRDDINERSESVKNEFKRILHNEVDVVPHNLQLPDTITINKPEGSTAYADHLYSNEEGLALVKLNEWETKTLDEERKDPDFVCWIRNLSKREEFLCIQYDRNGKLYPMFPDFIVIKKNGNGGYRVDILEPHRPDLDDNLYKAKGLARYAYAHQNKTQLKRCEMIRIEATASGDRFLRLNTTKTGVQKNVIDATNENTLNTLFSSQ